MSKEVTIEMIQEILKRLDQMQEEIDLIGDIIGRDGDVIIGREEWCLLKFILIIPPLFLFLFFILFLIIVTV